MTTSGCSNRFLSRDNQRRHLEELCYIWIARKTSSSFKKMSYEYVYMGVWVWEELRRYRLLYPSSTSVFFRLFETTY